MLIAERFLKSLTVSQQFREFSTECCHSGPQFYLWASRAAVAPPRADIICYNLFDSKLFNKFSHLPHKRKNGKIAVIDMKLSVYLSGLIIAVLLASACLAAILIYLSPDMANPSVFILFYLSLFIAATGIFTLIGLFIRWISDRRGFSLSVNRAFRQLGISFRQGLLLTVILISALVLQSKDILTWWHLPLLVGMVGLAEWWLSRKT
ncbi:MAG: hypothetical protein U9P63_03485 [Patescibacteria group bacterium]|nr:hypothetical protein [Patescibacteria group bacterium]